MGAMRLLLVALLGLPLLACHEPPDLIAAPPNAERLLMFEDEIWELPTPFVPRHVDQIYVEVEACVEADGPGVLWVWSELDGDALSMSLPHCLDGVMLERLWVETVPPHAVFLEAEALDRRRGTSIDVRVTVLGW